MKKIFTIFVLFFILLTVNQTLYAKLVKVDVISDSHISLSQDANGEYKMTPSIKNLKVAVKDINDTDVDYVVFTGDCVNSATKESITMFSKIINSLHKPYYVLIGNKDVIQVAGVDKKKFYQIVNRFSKNKTKRVPSVKVVDNKLVFIFMDGVNQFIPGTKGYFVEEDLLWLDKKLNKYKNSNVIIFQHFPIVEPKEHSAFKTTNISEYEDVLKRHDNVRAIVSGHYQVENEIMKDNIFHISVPGLNRNAEYKELNIEYDTFGKNFEIRTKIHDAI